MDRLSFIEHLSAANAERVLAQLTLQQHLRPSISLKGTIERLCHDGGYSAATASVVLSHTTLSPAIAVGRLSRVQIIAVAQRIALAWQATFAPHKLSK